MLSLLKRLCIICIGKKTRNGVYYSTLTLKKHMTWWPGNTIEDFGFPTKIIDLIMCCITFSSLALKWNEVYFYNFSPKRGLRQGDHLSLPHMYGKIILSNLEKG